MQNNTQLPFAFQKRPRVHKPVHRTSFSRNIKGLCLSCARPFQRLKKHDTEGNKLPVIRCPRCARIGLLGTVKELPESLRPWKILSRSRDYNGFFNIKFACQGCNTPYYDFSTFGALCNHDKHIPPGGWFCRFCCSKDESNVKTTKKVDIKISKKVLYPPRMVRHIGPEEAANFGPEFVQAWAPWQRNEIMEPALNPPDLFDPAPLGPVNDHDLMFELAEEGFDEEGEEVPF